MRKFIYLVIVALSVLSFSGCSNDATTANNEQIVWRLSHEESVGSIQDQYAQKFKELIEENQMAG